MPYLRLLVVSWLLVLDAQDGGAQDLPNYSAKKTQERGPTNATVADSKQDELPMRVSASFFSRYEGRQHYDKLGLVGRRIGEMDAVVYRARTGMTMAPIAVRSGWHAQLDFVPQASGYWGDISGGLRDAELGIHEAGLTIVGRQVSIEVGRFEMAYGDHLVIGDVGWHQTGRSFDGVRVVIPLAQRRAQLDLFMTQVAEGGASGAPLQWAGGDVYFIGGYATLGALAAEGGRTQLDAYGLGHVYAPNEIAVPETDFAFELTIGTRFRQELASFVVRAEAGLQAGQRPQSDEVLAAQIDGEVMLSVAHATKLGIGALYATGDDPESVRDTGWNQLYPTAHKFLGLMDIIGPRTNIASAMVKVRHDLTSSLSLALDSHIFARPETAPGEDAFTGLENEVWLDWHVGGGLGLRSQYAIFMPSSDGKFGTDELAHYVELQLSLIHN